MLIRADVRTEDGALEVRADTRVRVLALGASAAIVLALLTACDRGQPQVQAKLQAQPAPKPIMAPFILRAEGSSNVTVRFFADGQAIHEIAAGGPRKVHDISFSSASGSPVITAMARLACGWSNVRINERFVRGGPQFAPDGKPLSAGLIHLVFDGEVPRDEIVIDNRGGEAASLRLGSSEARVGADWIGQVLVTAPDCVEGAELTLGTKPLGKIDKHPGNASHRRAFLADPTGKRCYERRSVAYGEPAKGEVPRDDPPLRLKRKMLHELPTPMNYEWYFGQAPDRIEVVKRIGEPRKGFGYRMVLREAPC